MLDLACDLCKHLKELSKSGLGYVQHICSPSYVVLFLTQAIATYGLRNFIGTIYGFLYVFLVFFSMPLEMFLLVHTCWRFETMAIWDFLFCFSREEFSAYPWLC